jgi:hypothetical protein
LIFLFFYDCIGLKKECIPKNLKLKIWFIMWR